MEYKYNVLISTTRCIKMFRMRKILFKEKIFFLFIKETLIFFLIYLVIKFIVFFSKYFNACYNGLSIKDADPETAKVSQLCILYKQFFPNSKYCFI